MVRKRKAYPLWGVRAAAVLAGICVLVLLEGLCRFFLPSTRLDNILNILEQDPELLWVQKARMDEDFFGTPIATDEFGLRNSPAERKSEKSLRILALGGSPTFGWGVASESTYAKRLEELLRHKYGEHIDVINGGVIGYSSHQGLKFLKRHWEDLKPDIVTVAYVINDVDSYRFFRSNGKSDRELGAPSVFSRLTAGPLRRLGLFRALQSIMRFAGPGDAVLPGKVRVPLKDYRDNLQEMVHWVRGRRGQIVFVKMPVNLPVGVLTKSAGEAAGHLEKGRLALNEGDCDRALIELEKALALNSALGAAHYYRGKCFQKAGRDADARDAMRRVKVAESYRCAQDALAYNNELGSLARALRIPLVDVVSAFKKKQDAYLFVDPAEDTIHPNESGHAIIAAELFKALVPLASRRLAAQ